MTRRAGTNIVSRRQAAAVGETQLAGAAEVHSVPPDHSTTRAAVHAWRGETRVTKLAPASYVSIPALALFISIWTGFTLPLVQTYLRGAS